MKNARIMICLFSLALMIINLAFPPWQFKCKNPKLSGLISDAGYSFLCLPPRIPPHKAHNSESSYAQDNSSSDKLFQVVSPVFWFPEINSHRLIIQSVIIISIFAFLLLLSYLFNFLPFFKYRTSKKEYDGCDLSSGRISASKQLIGLTIKSIVIRKRAKNIPRCQLIIGFTNNNTFEFYMENSIAIPAKGLCADNYMLNPTADSIDILRIGC